MRGAVMSTGLDSQRLALAVGRVLSIYITSSQVNLSLSVWLSAVSGHVPRGTFRREARKGGHGPVP